MPSENKLTKIARYLFDPRKDIELFGMYGAANLGDEAMEDAGLAVLPRDRTVSTLSDVRVAAINRARWSRRRKHFVLGGGTLVHGGSVESGNGWLDFAEHRQKQGSEIALFGTGISFTADQVANRSESFSRWQHVLQRAAKVAVRGPLSQAFAAEMDVVAECFGDAAFALFDPTRILVKRNAKRLAVNFGECLGDQRHYEAINARLLASLPADLHIVAFVVIPSDRAATDRILAGSGLAADRITVVEEFWDPDAYMRAVAGCHAFVGLKLHAAGLALIAGVPSLLFQYKEKCLDFYTTLELEEGMLDLTMSEGALGQKVEALLGRPERFVNIAKVAEFKSHQNRVVSEYFSTR